MTPEAIPRRIVIIDCEASCLAGDGRRSYPIEVAAGLPETGAIRSWLIKPERQWLDEWDWHYEAELVHRLTRDHLLAHGLPRAQVARELRAFIGDRAVVSDYPPAEGYWLAVLFGEAQPWPVGALGALLDAIAGGGPPGQAMRALADAHARHVAARTHRAGDDVRHMMIALLELLRLAERGGSGHAPA